MPDFGIFDFFSFNFFNYQQFFIVVLFFSIAILGGFMARFLFNFFKGNKLGLFSGLITITYFNIFKDTLLGLSTSTCRDILEQPTTRGDEVLTSIIEGCYMNEKISMIGFWLGFLLLIVVTALMFVYSSEKKKKDAK